jgi:hypothetical protein
MSRKPGSHPSNIGKGNAHFLGFGGDLEKTSGEIDEQLVILRREDIHAEAPAAPLLDWSRIEKGEIAVQMKDLDGFAEGTVTLKASTLQRLHPLLVPARVDSDYLFQVSLKSVVMQVQWNLRRSEEDGPVRSGSEFETPIAQIAREDEDYFKLEKFHESQEPVADKTTQAKPKSSQPVLTPADRPAVPVPRKQHNAPEPGESTAPRAEPLTVSIPSPVTVLESDAKPMECGRPWKEFMAKLDRERDGHERLREIFMTEEYLSVDKVAHRIAGLPKICSALVLSADGTVLGGTLPEGYRFETAILAPALMRQVQEFGRGLLSSETTAFTLLGEKPISLFAEGNIHILISHKGRGLVPGMRNRIREIATALDTICGTPESGFGKELVNTK